MKEIKAYQIDNNTIVIPLPNTSPGRLVAILDIYHSTAQVISEPGAQQIIQDSKSRFWLYQDILRSGIFKDASAPHCAIYEQTKKESNPPP